MIWVSWEASPESGCVSGGYVPVAASFLHRLIMQFGLAEVSIHVWARSTAPK